MSFDFAAAVRAPFRMQPGLRRLPAGSDQLTPIDAAHLSEKIAVLSQRWPEALCQQPSFDPSPMIAALAEHAAAEHPALFGWAAGAAVSRRLGWSVSQATGQLAPAQDPQDSASSRARLPASLCAQVGPVLEALPATWRLPALLALSFDEDFAIVDGETASIPWLAVCLPSSWQPAEKVGLPFAELHRPVADGDLLRAAGAQLLRLVSSGEPWERFVWTITTLSTLGAHPRFVQRPDWPAEACAADLARAACWRTERQTFITVPGRRYAVFTIRIAVTPLVDAIASPEDATALADALATMSDAVLDYRGLGAARDRLVQWCRSVGASS